MGLTLAGFAPIVSQQWTQLQRMSLSVATKMPDQNVSGNHLEYQNHILFEFLIQVESTQALYHGSYETQNSVSCYYDYETQYQNRTSTVRV